MPGCRITEGFGVTCDTIKAPAGVSKRFWAFNIEDLRADRYTTDGNGYIIGINFIPYNGLVVFEGRKNAHQGGYTTETTDGGNTEFIHQVIAKLFPSNPTQDTVVEDMAVSDMGIILETNSGEFMLYGKDNGLTGSEQVQNTQAVSGDTSTTVTLTGREGHIPARILNVDYATTLAMLQSYEVDDQ